MANALPKIATGIGYYDLARQRSALALYSSDNEARIRGGDAAKGNGANGSRNSR
jgi:hypothetical protein